MGLPIQNVGGAVGNVAVTGLPLHIFRKHVWTCNGNWTVDSSIDQGRQAKEQKNKRLRSTREREGTEENMKVIERTTEVSAQGVPRGTGSSTVIGRAPESTRKSFKKIARPFQKQMKHNTFTLLTPTTPFHVPNSHVFKQLRAKWCAPQRKSSPSEKWLPRVWATRRLRQRWACRGRRRSGGSRG